MKLMPHERYTNEETNERIEEVFLFLGELVILETFCEDCPISLEILE